MDQEINQQRIKNIGQMLLEMAAGNFVYRIPRTGNDDELEGLTVLVNWVSIEFPAKRAFLKDASNACVVELWRIQ
jgi:hypothetical protein